MRPIQYLAILFLALCASGLSHARSCEPSSPYQIGDKAVYRFTEADAPSINLSIEVAKENSEEYLFSIVEDGVSYVVSATKGGCKTSLGTIQVPSLTAPLYTKNYRLYAILNTYLFVFGPEFADVEENRLSTDCITETSIDYKSCTALYSPAASNGVVQVDTRRNSALQNTVAYFVKKSQQYSDGRVDTIELIESERGLVSFVKMPQSLRGVAYSQTAAEIFWAQAPADELIRLYEIRRDGIVIDYRTSNNFYDPNRKPGEEYVYEVTAIGPNASRSEPARIVVNRMGDVTPTIKPVLPSVLPEVTNISATTYSETAGELFWTRIISDFPVRYDITRDGVAYGQTTGNSFFDRSLQPGVRYDYTVTSIGPGDVASQPVSVSMTAQGTLRPESGDVQTSFTLDSAVYSRTALELFWPSYTEIPGTRPLRYEVYRNGELARPVEGRSYFTDELSRNTAYDFQVLVFDGSNQQIAESQVVTVRTQP